MMARYGDRYDNCGNAVDKWYETVGEGTSTFDICDKCIVERGDELLTKGIGRVKPYGENEPVGDELGSGVARPPYTNGCMPAMDSWYKCAVCNVILVDREDGWDDYAPEPYYCFEENKFKIEKLIVKAGFNTREWLRDEYYYYERG
jgi:hypothetical protein